MHPHGIEVLDRAHDDDVVVAVAHHLELELVPALDGVLDEHLVDRALTQPSLHLRPELLDRVRKASTVAAECEGGTHHRRNRDPAEVVDGGDDARLGRVQATALDSVPEQLPVLGTVDHVHAGAEQLHSELFEHSSVRELDRDVQGRLAPQCRQDRVRPLASEHVAHALQVEWLDVGAIGKARVGHDRGRVRVDDDRAVSVLTQHLERLAARIVELAGLPDHDRAGADHADRVDIATGGHYVAAPSVPTHRSRIGHASCVPGPASG